MALSSHRHFLEDGDILLPFVVLVSLASVDSLRDDLVEMDLRDYGTWPRPLVVEDSLVQACCYS